MMLRKGLVKLKCVALAIFVLSPLQYAQAYTPAIQAALFNAAVRDIDAVKQERLISYTRALFNTLNSRESTALVGHQQLRVSSYMYLIEHWQESSLEKILYERGLSLSLEALKTLSIEPSTFKMPLKYVGPLNRAVNEVQGGTCTVSVNKSFNKTYQDVYNAILKLQTHLQDNTNEIPAQAALLYLKAYYFLKLHTPNSVFTYVNDQCISDVNGLMTCADEWVDAANPSPEQVERIRGYMAVDFDKFSLSKSQKAELMQCKVTLWHYVESGGMTEPLNDAQTIAASESIIKELDPAITQYARGSSLTNTFRDAQEIMHFLYFPQRHEQPKEGAPYYLGQTLLLNQMKVASIRLSELMKRDQYLAPKGDK